MGGKARQMPQTYATSRDLDELKEEIKELREIVNGKINQRCSCGNGIPESVCDGGREGSSEEAVDTVQREQTDASGQQSDGDGVQGGSKKRNTPHKESTKQGNERKTKGSK